MNKYWPGIKSWFNKLTEFQIVFILSIIFLLIRLPDLRAIPIVNDESIYLDWGWRMVNLDDASFFSLIDSKTPLLMWIFGYSQKVFSDPLLAGRLVSVMFGLAGALGLYFTSTDILNKKTGIVAFYLYTLNPLFSFYDRQAMMETAVSTAGIWSFYFFKKTINKKEYVYSAVLGFLLGLGYFIKSNAFTFTITVFILGIVIILKKGQKRKEQLLLVLAVTFIVALIVVSPLVFNSIFWKTLEDNQRYVLTPKQLIRFPFSLWLDNFRRTFEVMMIYLNPVIIISSLYVVYETLKKGSKKSLILVFWLLVSMILVNILARRTHNRYVVSFLPLFIVTGSYGLQLIFRKSKLLAISLIILLLPTFF